MANWPPRPTISGTANQSEGRRRGARRCTASGRAWTWRSDATAVSITSAGVPSRIPASHNGGTATSSTQKCPYWKTTVAASTRRHTS